MVALAEQPLKARVPVALRHEEVIRQFPTTSPPQAAVMAQVLPPPPPQEIPEARAVTRVR